VQAYDPVSMEQAKLELPDITYCDSPYSCAARADALVIVTEWEQFRALDMDRLKKEMAQPVIVDLRNVYRPDEMAKYGFTYESIGRQAMRRVGIDVASASGELPGRSDVKDLYEADHGGYLVGSELVTTIA
jgi:hypothetical protein